MTTRRVDDDVYRLMARAEILLLDKKTKVSFENCKEARLARLPGLQRIVV